MSVRNHDELQVAIPRARHIIGSLLFLLALLIFFGVLPFEASILAIALLLVAAGLLV